MTVLSKLVSIPKASEIVIKNKIGEQSIAYLNEAGKVITAYGQRGPAVREPMFLPKLVERIKELGISTEQVSYNGRKLDTYF